MRCLAQTPGHNSTSRPKSVFASKIDTFEWGGGKERFQSLYGPTAEMFTQQGARCLSLLWIQKCPGHIAYEGDITLAHVDFKARNFSLLEPLAEATYGLTLVFDHMEMSLFISGKISGNSQNWQ